MKFIKTVSLLSLLISVSGRAMAYGTDDSFSKTIVQCKTSIKGVKDNISSSVEQTDDRSFILYLGSQSPDFNNFAVYKLDGSAIVSEPENSGYDIAITISQGTNRKLSLALIHVTEEPYQKTQYMIDGDLNSVGGNISIFHGNNRRTFVTYNVSCSVR